VSRRRVVRLAKDAAAELEEALNYLYGGDGEWAADKVRRALELIWEIEKVVER